MNTQTLLIAKKAGSDRGDTKSCAAALKTLVDAMGKSSTRFTV